MNEKDDRDLDFPQERITRNRRNFAGYPEKYYWDGFAGRFVIHFDAEGSKDAVWYLAIHEEGDCFSPKAELGSYADPADAMVAVFNQQTGYDPWDNAGEILNKPRDAKAWQEFRVG